MHVNREQLHHLIDAVDASEYAVLYRLLSKFIPEDAPADDEVEAMRIGREAFEKGEIVGHEDIDWN